MTFLDVFRRVKITHFIRKSFRSNRKKCLIYIFTISHIGDQISKENKYMFCLAISIYQNLLQEFVFCFISCSSIESDVFSKTYYSLCTLASYFSGCIKYLLLNFQYRILMRLSFGQEHSIRTIKIISYIGKEAF